MCNHEIEAKVENNFVVTYCKKCGAIINSKPLSEGSNKHSDRYTQHGDRAERTHFNNEDYYIWHDNGGKILHD